MSITLALTLTNPMEFLNGLEKMIKMLDYKIIRNKIVSLSKTGCGGINIKDDAERKIMWK